MDQSYFFFNFFLMGSPTVIRWLMRSAYKISGDGCIDDYLIPCLCTPCAVNQMYQTSKAWGNRSTDGGRAHNNRMFSLEASEVSVISSTWIMAFQLVTWH